MIVTEENYNQTHKLLTKLRKKTKSPRDSYSPNTGFALTTYRNGQEVVWILGTKKDLLAIVEINNALAVLDGESITDYNLVAMDSTVKFYHHYEFNNNYTYMTKEG